MIALGLGGDATVVVSQHEGVGHELRAYAIGGCEATPLRSQRSRLSCRSGIVSP